MLSGIKKLTMEEIRAQTDITITVGNVYSSVIAPAYVLKRLEKAFSFEDPDAERKRDYNIKHWTERGRPDKVAYYAEWDGRKSVFDLTKVGTGILEDVLMFLEEHDFTVKIIDKTIKPKKVIIPLGPRMKTLTDDQQQAFDILESRDFRGLIYASVAYGKTVLAMRVIHELQTFTVILVDRKRIVEQWREQILDSLNVEETKLKGASAYVYSSYQTRREVIMLCTHKLINSAQKKTSDPQTTERNFLINRLIQNAGLLIYDEVHHASSKEPVSAVGRIMAYHRIGLSGTIGIREDNTDYLYYALIGNPVYYFSSSDLVNLGRGKKVLIKPITIQYDRSFISNVMADRNDWSELYMSYIVANRKRNVAICNIVMREAGEGSHILVLVDRVDHASTLAAMLGEHIAVWTDSKDKLRADKFHLFTSGQISTMICTFSLAGEGFDYPELNVLVLASAKSEIKLRQSMGRVMRKSIHDTATVYDFVDPIQPFKNHFLARLEVYGSEPAFELENEGKDLPHWARSYLP